MGPAFIPRAEVKPGVRYRGYIATPDGLVRQDRAAHRGTVATGARLLQPVDAPPGTPRAVKVSHGDWGVEPNRKRTHAERVDSLASRIWQQNTEGGGLTESIGKDALALVERVGREGVTDDVIRNLQALALKAGRFETFEECRRLAALYMTNAQKEWDGENDKRVARKSTDVLDTP